MVRTFFTFDNIHPKICERIDIELKEIDSELYTMYGNMYIAVQFPTDFTARLFRAVREVISSYIKIEKWVDSIDFKEDQFPPDEYIILKTPEELKPRIIELYIELLKQVSMSITVSIRKKGQDNKNNEIVIGFPTVVNYHEIMHLVKTYFDMICVISNSVDTEYYIVTYKGETRTEILGIVYGNIVDYDDILKRLFETSSRQDLADLMILNPTKFSFYKLKTKPEKIVEANLQLAVETKEIE